jgi:NADPH:quinone reductase-like Zn-dependent oxidoreductase
MRAIVYRKYGSPDVLSCEEIEKPVPAANEVLIRVQAASVNPYDWHFSRGKPGFIRLFTGLRHPKSPRLGADVAGYVEAVGNSVTQFKPGDAVFGTGSGAFAEFACAAASTLAIKPDNVSFQDAASIPIAAITALQGLRDKAHVQAGQTVLINGAAGGVGTFAVQIAHWMGATVSGVCSARNVELVRSIGADHVIDYTREDFSRSNQHYDVIFDLVGNRPLSAFRLALKPRGLYIGCGGGGPDRSSIELLGRMFGQAAISPFVSQKLVGVLAKINNQDLIRLGELIASKTVTPVIDRVYTLAEVPDAMRYQEIGHVRGKVIIQVA